jgi:hypothetical protein
MENMDWFTGSGESIVFERIVELVKAHYAYGGAVYIGTDSHLKQDRCIFSTAVCLTGGPPKAKNLYFTTRSTQDTTIYASLSSLIHRIAEEVQLSVATGLKLLEACPKIDIELHLDVSPEHLNEGTSRFANMLVGYARGSGFACKIKPDAFAASSVADKHSKP